VCSHRSLRSYVAQRPAGDVMTTEERAALEAPTAAAKKEAVAAAHVAAAAAAAAAAQDAVRRRCGPGCAGTRSWTEQPCAGFRMVIGERVRGWLHWGLP